MSLQRKARLREELANRGNGADAHDRRIDADRSERLEESERLLTELLGASARGEERGGGTVGERRGVTRRDAAFGRENRLQTGEAFECGLGANELVLGERKVDALVAVVFDGHDGNDLRVELLGFASEGRLLVALVRKLVLVFAGDGEFRQRRSRR